MKRLPEIVKNAGYWLRVWRAEHNLTQYEAARLFNISPSHYSRIEAGLEEAGEAVAQQFADATKHPLVIFRQTQETTK